VAVAATALELLRALPAEFWVVVHAAPATWAAYHVLLYKRDSRSATGWIMACMFIPFAGPVAYFLFGINRVRSRAQDMRRPFYHVAYETGIRRAAIAGPPADASSLESVGARTTGRAVVGGNDVAPLFQGDEAYPAMLDAIAAAQKRVYLSTYIIKMDPTGVRFIDRLEAAAQRGVDVRVLIDGIGELYAFRRVVSHLRLRGIPSARFLPPRLLPPSIHVNLRNHRKLLVVDNAVAFAGGMNISEGNTASPGRARSISDIHFRLRGPVVDELAAVFLDDWSFATHESGAEEAGSQTVPCGDVGCRVIPDGPDRDLDALALTIEAAVSAACESIDIMTPYFLPSRDLLASLISATLRGVRVRIVLPAENNLWYVHWANRNLLAELVQWSAEVYYQPPPFCHSKLLCVDGAYTLIGSANLDPRSLRLNFEVGIELFSEPLTQRLRGHVEQIIAVSRRATRDELGNRSIPARLRDSAAALLSPYL
jgi:cardiolipin synthase